MDVKPAPVQMTGASASISATPCSSSTGVLLSACIKAIEQVSSEEPSMQTQRSPVQHLIMPISTSSSGIEQHTPTLLCMAEPLPAPDSEIQKT